MTLALRPDGWHLIGDGFDRVFVTLAEAREFLDWFENRQ